MIVCVCFFRKWSMPSCIFLHRQWHSLSFQYFAFSIICFYFSSMLSLFNKLNIFKHTSHAKLIDSITYCMKRNRLNHQSSRMEKDSFDSVNVCQKIDSGESTQSSWSVYKRRQELNRFIARVINSSCALNKTLF